MSSNKTNEPSYDNLVPSSKESRFSGGTAGMLDEERALANFDISFLRDFWNGGKKNTAKRRWIQRSLEEFYFHDKHEWTREEYIKRHVHYFVKLHKELALKFKPTADEIAFMSENALLFGAMNNHYNLFVTTLKSMASEEQLGWWLKKSLTFQIVGCYAQTELGHGSNVRGLQTTAHYDKKTQEFILNTPTLRSIKWWPGGLGKVSTHAVVFAQLIIDDKEYGVHPFMLQMRDENHMFLTGVEAGDMGPKMGDNANDNGYLLLTDVRIPRRFLLERFQEVSPEGKYVELNKTNKNAHYATMLHARGHIVRSTGGLLGRMVTVAVRYSCVRTQGFTSDERKTSFKDTEYKVMDYRTQQYRVFKQLSITFALRAASRVLNKMFKRMDEIKTGGKAESDMLKELAATSGGLKSLVTILGADGMEVCRKCCGGNGYLLNSGIGANSQDFLWVPTAEGDWMVMILLNAKYLLWCIKQVMSGNEMTGTAAYLNRLPQLGMDISQAKPKPVDTLDAFMDIDYLKELFLYSALSTVANGAKAFMERTAEYGFNEAFNEVSNLMFEAAKRHNYWLMCDEFHAMVSEMQDESTRDVLENLYILYVTTNMLDEHWGSLLDEKQYAFARQASEKMLKRLRVNAVAIVDAFDFPDYVLNSTLGCADGNPYERLFEQAKNTSLNKKEPFDGYEELLRPHLDTEFLKKGNVLPKL